MVNIIDILSANLNIVALIEIFGLFIGIWVYLDNPKNRINQFFSLMTFFVLLWVIFGYLSHSQSLNLSNLILYRLNLAIVCIFFIFAYYFSIYFPKEGKQNNLLSKSIVALELFISLIMIFTDLIIKEERLTNWGVNFVLGRGSFVFYLMVYLVTSLVFYNFFKKYFTLSLDDKLKVQYFLIGISLFALFNLTFNVTIPIIWSSFRYYWLGDYSVVFLLGFTAWSCS